LGVRLSDAVKYILSKKGCVHPFRLSRILALAEIYYYKDKNSRLTDALYVLGPGVFYIEGFKEMIKQDECIEKREGDPSKGLKGCIYLTCKWEKPLSPEVSKYLDRAIEESDKYDDMGLNNYVISNSIFRRIAGGEG